MILKPMFVAWLNANSNFSNSLILADEKLTYKYMFSKVYLCTYKLQIKLCYKHF